MVALKNDFVDLKDLESAHQTNLELTEGKPFCILLDTKVPFLMADGVRERLASKEYAEYRTATALVVKSLSSRLIGNFFITVNKPPQPTRMFSTYADAFSWLNTICEGKKIKSSRKEELVDSK